MAFNNKYDHTKSEAFFDDEPLRHRSSVFSRRARSNLEEVPMWPVITGLAVLFIWAVNAVSPGALSFITGFSFIDSLMLGIIIGSLYAIAQYRKREHDHMVEEILDDLAQEETAEQQAEHSSAQTAYCETCNSQFTIHNS